MARKPKKVEDHPEVKALEEAGFTVLDYVYFIVTRSPQNPREGILYSCPAPSAQEEWEKAAPFAWEGWGEAVSVNEMKKRGWRAVKCKVIL